MASARKETHSAYTARYKLKVVSVAETFEASILQFWIYVFDTCIHLD